MHVVVMLSLNSLIEFTALSTPINSFRRIGRPKEWTWERKESYRIER